MKRTLFLLSIILLSWTPFVHAKMYDPFRKTAKTASSVNGLIPPPPMITAAPVPTIVSAIMNNKAYINGAWYKIGDRVNNKEITYIQNNFVGFKDENRLTMISVTPTRHVLGTKELP